MSERPYEIKITQTAFQGLRDAQSYIREELHNPQAAEKLLSDFQETAEYVASFPLSMPKTVRQHEFEYRKFFVGKFIAIYRIEESEKVIYISAFRYAPMALGDSV